MNDKQRIKFFSFLSWFFLFLTGCTDDEQPERLTNRPAGGVYGDYQVWAEEESEDVTIRLQFRRGDAEGEALEMGGAGTVLLDGEEVPADSTRFTGVYYEITKPLETFQGDHVIQFTDEQGRVHKEEFTFEPFTLKRELPGTIRRRPFQIRLQNVPNETTQIRLVMVDTSLFSTDVNEELLIEEGIIEITDDHLANLTEGPVTLEIYREEERLVKGVSEISGKFTMTYALRRDFNLTE